MYYCVWCGYDAGWPTNRAASHDHVCCLCGERNRCIDLSHKKIIKERKKLTPIDNNDINKALTELILRGK